MNQKNQRNQRNRKDETDEIDQIDEIDQKDQNAPEENRLDNAVKTKSKWREYGESLLIAALIAFLCVASWSRPSRSIQFHGAHTARR